MREDIKKKFQEIKKSIKRAENVLLLAHRAPDGDAISSILALNLYLREKGKKSLIFAPNAPQFLKFLPSFEEIKTRAPKNFNFDLIFALDYASRERIEVPPKFLLDPEKVISIDHHPGGVKIGKIRITLPDASSVAEIIYYFFREVGEKIDKKIATLLLNGIFTDTVGFSIASKGNEKVIGELIAAGGDLSKIMREYNSFPLSRAKLLAKMILRIKEDKNLGLLWSWLSFSDFKEEKEDVFFQGAPVFPDFLSRIGKAKVYLFLVEYKGGKIRGSLRSRSKIDVAKIAEKFGGGGHRSASGFKMKGELEVVLEKVKKELTLHQILPKK